MMQTPGPIAFYNSGYHFLFYCLVSAHVCLLTDISPLQKKPFCDLNFLIATVIAAAIPSVITSLIVFQSYTVEIAFGIGLAVLSGLLITLNIQRIIDLDVYF